jgi:hypothetical protein
MRTPSGVNIFNMIKFFTFVKLGRKRYGLKLLLQAEHLCIVRVNLLYS